MAERDSLYQVFRKRIAPVAFMIALSVLALRTCSAEMAHVEMVFDLGAAAPSVRVLRVDVFPRGSSTGVIHFERHYNDAGATTSPRFAAQLSPGTYELAFTIALQDARRRFDRVVEVTDDRSVLTVRLERDLVRSAD